MHCLRQVLHSGKRVATTILSPCVTVLYTELLSSRLHLPHLPTKCTWCISSHLKRRLSLVFIFHISLVGVYQATSSAAFL